MYGMTADVAVAGTATGHESGPACTTYRLIGGVCQMQTLVRKHTGGFSLVARQERSSTGLRGPAQPIRALTSPLVERTAMSPSDGSDCHRDGHHAVATDTDWP